MTPQELQYVQMKIGDSFLKSFYPADYRAMRQTTDSLIKLENEEYRRLKTTDDLTSKINIKLARTISLLEKEINQLLAALDNVQNTVSYVGDEMVDVDTLSEGMDRATGGFDLFGTWRQIMRVRRILKKRQKDIEKKKKKAEEKEKTKRAKEQEEKERAAEEERLKRQNAPDAEVRPQGEPEAGPKAPGQAETPGTNLAQTAEDFVKNPNAATEGAFKAALKKSTDPKSVLSALKTAKSAYIAFDEAATNVLNKILGSKLVRFGGTALIIGIEAWGGWEDYVLVRDAYDKGLLTAAMKSTLVRNIIATHSLVAIASVIFGSIGTAIGASVGVAALGVGAIVGGILGGIVGGVGGAMAAGYLAEILLENKTFSDYFDDAIDAVSEAAGYDYIQNDQATPTTQAQQSPAEVMAPATSPVAPAPEQQAQAPQTVAGPIQAPSTENAPITQSLPVMMPTPMTYETPSLAPSTEAATGNIDPNLVRDSIANQLNNPGVQRTQPGSDTTQSQAAATSDQINLNPTSSENKKMVTLQTGSGKSYQVNEAFAPNFNGFVKALEATGYQIRSIGGYNDRNIKGKNKKSFHSVGAAIDINPEQNPYTSGELITDMPDGIAGLAANFGLGWGGSWNGDKDAMHFSAATAERGAYKIDRNTGAIMAAAGGKIHPQQGGTLTLLAEAGEPEYVVPQSKVVNFAHEMLASQPNTRIKTKKRTHVMIVPIYT